MDIHVFRELINHWGSRKDSLRPISKTDHFQTGTDIELITQSGNMRF